MENNDRSGALFLLAAPPDCSSPRQTAHQGTRFLYLFSRTGQPGSASVPGYCRGSRSGKDDLRPVLDRDRYTATECTFRRAANHSLCLLHSPGESYFQRNPCCLLISLGRSPPRLWRRVDNDGTPPKAGPHIIGPYALY